uniref:Uncharacterized protein n=1 Tax=viral metagenome TaxID=1070528 RepID=A0A6H1ZQF0_9ZZZZ
MNYKTRCLEMNQNPYDIAGHSGGFWKCLKCGAESEPFDPDVHDEPGDDWVHDEGYTPDCPGCGGRTVWDY